MCQPEKLRLRPLSIFSSQHTPNALFKRFQVLINNPCYRQRIDIAQIVVYENIAKTTDFTPRDMGMIRFHIFWQMSSGLRQCLQIA